MKNMVVVIITVSLVSGALGYYFAPGKVKIETKTVEVIKEVKVEAKTEKKKKDKTYTKVVTTHTDGTTTSTSTIVEKDRSTSGDITSVNTDTTIKRDETKEVTKSSSRLNLSALAGVNVLNPSSGMVYGGSLTKDVLGHITIGAFGLSNGLSGLSLGVSF